MLYGYVGNKKELPEPGLTATCPLCDGELVAKCGEIKMWHWAHKNKAIDCEKWNKGETDWHLHWKSLFPKEWTEVTIKKDGEVHRADVQLPSGRVLEFQHSSISPKEIKEREEFYGDMVWIFDVRNCDICTFDFEDENIIHWSHPQKSKLTTKQPIFLEIGRDKMLYLYKIDVRTENGGVCLYGDFYSVDNFVNQVHQMDIISFDDERWLDEEFIEIWLVDVFSDGCQPNFNPYSYSKYEKEYIDVCGRYRESEDMFNYLSDECSENLKNKTLLAREFDGYMYQNGKYPTLDAKVYSTQIVKFCYGLHKYDSYCDELKFYVSCREIKEFIENENKKTIQLNLDPKYIKYSRPYLLKH